MIFSSSVFLFIFLPIVLLVHTVVGQRYRNLVLLICSFGFYAWGEGLLIFVMLYCIVGSWMFGLLLDRNTIHKKRKALLFAGIAINLVPLAYYKYWGFLLENIDHLSGSRILSIGQFDIPVLPIGISFFTFQSLSYLIDVYRRQSPVQASSLNLGLYISLFPQLIAGPIVRYKDIQEQIHRRVVNLTNFAAGAERFIYGLGKKLLIANPMGEMADRIFSIAPSELTLSIAWIGILCYALQIYFDFSGYSSMAIGLGRMLGFKFLENFNYPYISCSVREFWRRWHISLSNWFRDYVYIPLGGNKGSDWKVARNLGIVFLLCGLWHGAAWNFIIWGVIHGMFLILERSRFGLLLKKLPKLIQRFYTLFVVIIAWVYFRASDIGYANGYLKALFNPESGYDLIGYVAIEMDKQFMVVAAIGLVLCTPVYRYLFTQISAYSENVELVYCNELLRYLTTLSILVLSIFEITLGSYNPFIYFRF